MSFPLDDHPSLFHSSTAFNRGPRHAPIVQSSFEDLHSSYLAHDPFPDSRQQQSQQTPFGIEKHAQYTPLRSLSSSAPFAATLPEAQQVNVNKALQHVQSQQQQQSAFANQSILGPNVSSRDYILALQLQSLAASQGTTGASQQSILQPTQPAVSTLPGGIGNLPGTTAAPLAQEEISTIFVVGFPDDMQEREFQNMFTFSQGFEAATLKIPNKELPSYGAHNAANGVTTTQAATAALRSAGYFSGPGASDPYNLLTANSGGVLLDSRELSSAAASGLWNGLTGADDPYRTNLDPAHAPAPPPQRKQIIGFAKFRTRQEALDAREILSGKRVDAEKGSVLKAEMAKKNLHTKRGVGPLPINTEALLAGLTPQQITGLVNAAGIGQTQPPQQLNGSSSVEMQQRDRDQAALNAMGLNGIVSGREREREREKEREREFAREYERERLTNLPSSSISSGSLSAYDAFHSQQNQNQTSPAGTQSQGSLLSGNGASSLPPRPNTFPVIAPSAATLTPGITPALPIPVGQHGNNGGFDPVLPPRHAAALYNNANNNQGPPTSLSASFGSDGSVGTSSSGLINGMQWSSSFSNGLVDPLDTSVNSSTTTVGGIIGNAGVIGGGRGVPSVASSASSVGGSVKSRSRSRSGSLSRSTSPKPSNPGDPNAQVETGRVSPTPSGSSSGTLSRQPSHANIPYGLVANEENHADMTVHQPIPGYLSSPNSQDGLADSMSFGSASSSLISSPQPLAPPAMPSAPPSTTMSPNIMSSAAVNSSSALGSAETQSNASTNPSTPSLMSAGISSAPLSSLSQYNGFSSNWGNRQFYPTPGQYGGYETSTSASASGSEVGSSSPEGLEYQHHALLHPSNSGSGNGTNPQSRFSPFSNANISFGGSGFDILGQSGNGTNNGGYEPDLDLARAVADLNLTNSGLHQQQDMMSSQIPSPTSGGSNASGLGLGPAPAVGRPNASDQNPPINTLYVGNLPSNNLTHPTTLEDALRNLFSRRTGYRKLCFRQKANGPMCFVEFDDVQCATKALNELYGDTLGGLVKGGIRLSFSKNPLGVRTPSVSNPSGPGVNGTGPANLFSAALAGIGETRYPSSSMLPRHSLPVSSGYTSDSSVSGASVISHPSSILGRTRQDSVDTLVSPTSYLGGPVGGRSFSPPFHLQPPTGPIQHSHRGISQQFHLNNPPLSNQTSNTSSTLLSPPLPPPIQPPSHQQLQHHQQQQQHIHQHQFLHHPFQLHQQSQQSSLGGSQTQSNLLLDSGSSSAPHHHQQFIDSRDPFVGSSPSPGPGVEA
ncbi:hypothetical protein FRC03_003670 [Tulasnella sp. 419]|nr:hypothetical protein FRC03_003670 [Tulasnella sp. 419]